MQMQAIIESYILWSKAVEENGLDGECEKPVEDFVDGMYSILVLDIFREFHFYLFWIHSLPSIGLESISANLLDDSKGIVANLVRQGLMPWAPFTPTFAIATRVLELYWNSHLRCPHLAIQPFVKGLCDLHRVSSSHCSLVFFFKITI